MAELVDAADSKSAEGNLVGVRFPSRVLEKQIRLCKLNTYKVFFYFGGSIGDKKEAIFKFRPSEKKVRSTFNLRLFFFQ